MGLNSCKNVFLRDYEKVSTVKQNEALKQIVSEDWALSIMGVFKELIQ